MSHEQTPPRLGLGIAICLLAYVFFVTASSIVWSFKAIFPTIQILFFLNFISFICILPVALRKGVHNLKTDFFPIHLLRDIAGVLSYYLYYVAIRFLNLTDATTLNYTAPFFVPIVWWIWMKERIDRHVWWSIIVGFIGVAIILNPTRQIFQEGFTFGLLAGVFSAIAVCALRVLNLKKESMSRTLFYYFLVGTLLSAPFASIYWVHPTPLQWLKLLGVGLSTVTAQMLLTVAFRYGTASFLSPLGYSTIVYAALSSWMIFDIQPGLRSLLGTLLIIAGGVLTFIFKKKPENLAQTFQVPDPKEKPPPL